MMKSNFAIAVTLILAFVLRIYGMNWDQGFHLHPDERALIMVTERIHLFKQLNPQFFNYGSLPIYILKGLSQIIDTTVSSPISNYSGMLYVGRFLSLFFDLGTIILIYKITLILFSTGSNNNRNKLILLFSSFFYAIAFFPIQNSHFFISDVFLTFFTTLLLYLLIKYLSIPSRHDRIKMVVFLGLAFAAMISTKFTAIIFYPIILLVLIYRKFVDKQLTIQQLAINFIIFNFSLLTFNFLFMPYAFLDYQRFISDITAQIKMNSDPYIFPYTLQYVGTIPYLYYLKNIFLWGLGPFISIFSLIGLFSYLYQISKIKYQKYISNIKNIKYSIFNMNILYFIFYILYFLIIGRSAVKFMRYMLPIYPFLTILAGYGIYQISKLSFLPRNEVRGKLQQESIKKILWIPTFVGMTLAIIWTSIFLNIYSQKHTRIAATEWILQNIPKGSTLAVEHWDDRVPLTSGENYNYVEMTLYDQPDDELKWLKLNEILAQTDYIIIASNRLYVPLQKLSDCKKYKSCYPKTAEYYRKLFSGDSVILGRTPTLRRGTTPESLLDSGQDGYRTVTRQAGMTQVRFKKVAEFAVYPKLEIGNWKLEIRDDVADESFTVYDHPKILIFKKI